jgi:hypothetical protein
MEEQTHNLRDGAAGTQTTADDPEKTLVAPRFDAREALTAQPVVPLADAPPARRERRQGSLPLLLILVSALVGGLVSVFAYRLYQQRAQQSSARAGQQQPAYVEAPALTPEISARAKPAETPAATPEVIEEPTPVTEVAEVRETDAPEETTAREEARDDRAGRDLEAAREERPATVRRPAARRVEEITTPTEDLGVRRERYDGKEASDYEVPARPRAERRAVRRAERRAERRAGERNIDRVRAIFEGSPPQ